MTVSRRCGCLDENGRQYGTRCPRLRDPKHGTWGYRFSAGTLIDRKSGKPKRLQISKGGFTTRKAALDGEAAERAKTAHGGYVRPSSVILADYATQWLQRRQVTGKGLKPTTVGPYARYIRKDIVPSRLGAMKLTDIRRHHINQFAADLTRAKRGATTVRRILTRLSTILATAVSDGLIGANPAVGADRPVLEHTTVRIWEPEHVRQFLMRCAHHRLGPLFEVAVLTGLRRGEITGLHWSDVDLVARKIAVRRNRVTVDGKITEQTT